MVQIPKIEIASYLDIAKRRKWWVIIPLFLALIVGGVHLYQSPKVYRASTLILVEAQKVPSEFVPSTVDQSVENRLQTISQQVHSRTNLEDIIERLELNRQAEGKEEPSLPEKFTRKLLAFVGLMDASAEQKENEKEEDKPSVQQMVSSVRNKIDVNLRARNQAFEISFEWRDPQMAAKVANALASQYIDQNLKFREEMAMGTTRFLESEVQRLREDLQKREDKLEEFKRRNMGRLPGQLESNLNILSQLKEELSRTEDRAEQVRQQMRLMEQQGQMQSQDQNEDASSQDNEKGSDEQNIAALRERLEGMRSTYTDKHPDVQRLQRRISQLEQEQEAGVNKEPESEDVSGSGRLGLDMQKMLMRLAEYKDKMQRLRQEITKYEQRVEQTSEVELKLKNLERDYAAVNDRFQNVLRRMLDAEMGEQMEKRQQGEHFRVVDPAITPNQPFKPDRSRVMAMALVIGLGLGGGLAYLRESLDPTFYTPEELENDLQAKVVVSLPFVHEEKKRRKT
ncbi:MAG: GNVR domain-containing protein [Desulfovermiculus sp.]